MSLLITALGIILLLVTVITIIYLIGRIDLLESFISTRLSATATNTQEKGGSTDTSFLGLEGKALWDALSGTGDSSVSEADVNSIRDRYAILLKKHITTLFTAGVSDGQKGASKRKIENPMSIATLRGSLNAWLPQQHVSSLYSVGYESARANDIDLARLLSGLTETIDVLYLRSGITMEPDLPQSLLNAATTTLPPSPPQPEPPNEPIS
ncbi:hypothetical protein OAD22_11270 [Pseudomonadales bacterium]|nr:hypothetical protein [Pseudomonadales bacterium]MDB9918334.1 hypothetical protein [Pseudomonadales bacterium]